MHQRILSKSLLVRLALAFLLLLLPASCGYHNPYVYNGKEKSIFLSTWKNRTNKLQFGEKIHQSLITWYEKSGAITVSQDAGNADLILAGEILAINLPSLAYGINNTAVQVKIYLDVRYVLKEMKTGKILLEVPRQTLSETYLITSDISTTNDNEAKAVDLIIDDLSERIYLNSINQLQQK
jgi:hypothetical protein